MHKRNYEKQKKTYSFIALIVVFFHIFSILPSMRVKASELKNQYKFITGVTLTDADGKVIDESSNPISKNSEVKLTYNFTVPNRGEVKKGDTYTIRLPKEIEIISKLNFPIKLDNGDTIADVTIDTDGKVNIVFTEFAEHNSNVSGYFYVDTQFNPNTIGPIKSVPIEFEIGGNSEPYVVHVNFEQPETPKASIKKEGTYNPSKNEITWKVTVNPENIRVSNAQIVDEILHGQELINGSIRVNGANALVANYNYSDKKLTYNFPEEIDRQQIITFKTKVTNSKISENEGASIYEYNKAVFNHDGISLESNQASVKIVTDFIRKNGSYDASAKRINWVIDINNNAQNIKDAIVVDDIPQGLKLTNGSVKIDGVSSNDYKLDGQKFEYIFKNDINEPHRITFSTDVVDLGAYNSNTRKEYKNTAILTGKGVPNNASDTKTVGVPTSVISKQGIGYNPATREITWKITVNSNNISIDKGLVTDEIKVGQEYIEGSAKIDRGTTRGVFEYTKASLGDKSKTGTLTYKFNDSIKEQHVITFKTRVTDPNVYAGNKTQNYYNVAKFTGDNIVPSTSQGRQTVESQVINKSSAGFDYVKREITWKIEVNRNKILLPNAYVTDVINEKQELVPDSIMINGKLAEASSYNYNKDTRTLTYNFPNEIKDQQVLTFKTKVVDESIFNTNGEKSIENKAKLITGLVPGGVESKGTAKIKSTLVSKTAEYTRGNSYIDWNVNVNSNKILMKDVILTDILQEGLELDVTSVKLHKQSLNFDGTLSKGEEVQLDKDNIRYDYSTREFSLKLPSLTDEAYMLTFRTNVVDKHKSPFVNSISFKGTGLVESSQSSKVEVIFQGAGGGGVGETGSIKVVKVDKDNENTKLEGAIFELLDKYENVIATSQPTGLNGETIFDKLRLDTDYYIREKTAPKGYMLSNEVYKFTLENTEEEKNIVYNYKNQRIGGKNIVVVDNVEGKPIDVNSNHIKDKIYATITTNNENNKVNNKGSINNTGNNVSSIIGTNNKKEAISILPKTGSFLDFKGMLGIGLITIISGVSLLLKKNK